MYAYYYAINYNYMYKYAGICMFYWKNICIINKFY